MKELINEILFEEFHKELIKKILKDFDFKKVHTAMLAVNWGWVQTDMKVPSVNQLKTCAKELLQEASEMEIGFSISTGGFTATKTDSEDMGHGLQLEFTLTSTMLYEDWLDKG